MNASGMQSASHGPGQRLKLVLAAGVPLMLLAALLVWGVLRTGGRQERPGVNDVYGVTVVAGREAPGFELPGSDGAIVSLSAFRGKPVLLDFWASWCAPCQQEGPTLAAAYDRWQAQGVEFVGVATWDAAPEVRRFITKNGARYANALDADGRVTISYGVKGVPEKFLITPDGRIVRRVVGPVTASQLDVLLSTLISLAATPAKGQPTQ